MPAVTLLEVEGVQTYYGESHVLEGVSLEVAEGEVVALVGRNGVGKTTTLRSVMQLTPPREGSVRYRDEELVGLSAHEVAGRGVGWIPEDRRVFSQLSVEENVRVAAQAHGEHSATFWRNLAAYEEYTEEAHRVLERVGLTDRAHDPAGDLSHGAGRQLEVAIALAGDPDVLLLDEPNAGVSSESVGDIIDLIEDVAEDHAVLLVEHNMDIVMEVSERVVVLNRGEVIADDDPAAVRDDPAVQEAYLGGYEPGDLDAADSGGIA